MDDVIHDIDWKTLVFLGAIFCLVEDFPRPDYCKGYVLQAPRMVRPRHIRVALVLLAGIGVLSSLLANVPVVAAALVMVKGYLVAAGVVPETALAAELHRLAAGTLPVFIAMMFGATLGGNATLIGASANVVGVGTCATNGQRITLARFLRYGVPLTIGAL